MTPALELFYASTYGNNLSSVNKFITHIQLHGNGKKYFYDERLPI